MRVLVGKSRIIRCCTGSVWGHRQANARLPGWSGSAGTENIRSAASPIPNHRQPAIVARLVVGDVACVGPTRPRGLSTPRSTGCRPGTPSPRAAGPPRSRARLGDPEEAPRGSRCEDFAEVGSVVVAAVDDGVGPRGRPSRTLRPILAIRRPPRPRGDRARAGWGAGPRRMGPGQEMDRDKYRGGRADPIQDG